MTDDNKSGDEEPDLYGNDDKSFVYLIPEIHLIESSKLDLIPEDPIILLEKFDQPFCPEPDSLAAYADSFIIVPVDQEPMPAGFDEFLAQQGFNPDEIAEMKRQLRIGNSAYATHEEQTLLYELYNKARTEDDDEELSFSLVEFYLKNRASLNLWWATMSEETKREMAEQCPGMFPGLEENYREYEPIASQAQTLQDSATRHLGDTLEMRGD